MPTRNVRRRRYSYRASLPFRLWRARRRRPYAAEPAAARSPLERVVPGGPWTLRMAVRYP